MSQEEVLKVLQKKKKPLSCAEISRELNSKTRTDRNKVTLALKKMVEYKEVKTIRISREEARVKYGSLRTMRLYYVE